jgi:hypothetical protein
VSLLIVVQLSKDMESEKVFDGPPDKHVEKFQLVRLGGRVVALSKNSKILMKYLMI